MSPYARVGRCICGVAISLHFDSDNRKLSCDAALARLGGPRHEPIALFGPEAFAAKRASAVLPFHQRTAIARAAVAADFHGGEQ